MVTPLGPASLGMKQPRLGWSSAVPRFSFFLYTSFFLLWGSLALASSTEKKTKARFLVLEAGNSAVKRNTYYMYIDMYIYVYVYKDIYYIYVYIYYVYKFVYILHKYVYILHIFVFILYIYI